ncbi:MAG: tyrosine-protein phosphatase [Ruminiclostridium sp.]|nr:tyrosine-protein phosphatase [Ruminiclostridium sp.]
MRQARSRTEDIIVQPVLYSQQSIGLQGAVNARELGGYISEDGRRIKRGRLIRSGQLCSLTAEDKRILSEKLHTGLVIDLRTRRETEDMPEVPDFGAAHINLPVVDGTDGGERDLYQRIMFSVTAGEAYRSFFRLLLESPDRKAILFHSVYGKDRTGVAAALLLTALGIPENTVIEDYLLSNKMKAYSVQLNGKQIELPAFRDNHGTPGNVYAHSLEFAFSTAIVEFGSIDMYLREFCGMSGFDIRALRDKFLES